MHKTPEIVTFHFEVLKISQGKKTNLKRQELLKLVDTVEEEHKNEEPLILNILSDNEIKNSDASLENEQEQKKQEQTETGLDGEYDFDDFLDPKIYLP